MDQGLGMYPGQSPKKIAKTVKKLLVDDKLREKMSANAIRISRPAATKDIARDIGKIALRKTDVFPSLGASLADEWTKVNR